MKDISGLVGELRMMKDFDIRPNFSDLSRKYGIDRHTIKKYYEKGGIPIRKSYRKKSKWDEFENEIVELMSMPHVSKRGVYRYLYNKYKDALPGNYNSFCGYTWRRDIHLKPKSKPHPLYEVDPGYQLQCDWKENLELHLKNGELITFNVFSATLGFSREHVFIYSTTKTADDFLRCTIEVFRRLGGITETFFTVELHNPNQLKPQII